MIFDVCICTHSPDLAVLSRTIQAICNQTLSPDYFKVIIVDNASNPKLSLDQEPLLLLKKAGIKTSLFMEEQLGVAHARVRALRETSAPSIVFVDDDNVLDEKFLENADAILKSHPEVGCFSGKIKVPIDVQVPQWVSPLLHSLAIREAGEETVIDWFNGVWALWMPVASAGMVARRSVTDLFMKNHGSRTDFTQFGRKGRQGLLSGEDYFIALSAVDVKMKCGYFPNLVMWHILNPRRFSFFYMLRLWFAYGITDVKREVYLGKQPVVLSFENIWRRLTAFDLKNESFRARFCYWVYQVVYVSGGLLRRVRNKI